MNMEEKRGPRVLKFELLSSCVSVDFWMTLSKKKLETFGLDASAKKITGSYSTGNSPSVSSILNIGYDAFEEKQSSQPLMYPAEGKLLLFNTMESFRDCDKQQLADQEGALLWNFITSGEALSNPSLLTKFFLTGYADLKKHVYRYWFLFPALVYPDALIHESEPVEISRIFSREDIEKLADFSDALTSEQNAFLVHHKDGSFELIQLRELPNTLNINGKISLCVVDGSALPDNPGWPARNILALYAYQVRSLSQPHRIQLICLRKRVFNGQRDVDRSIVMDLRIVFTPDQIKETPLTPRTVGWERDEKSRLQPKMIDLSSQMDPQKLAEQAVDLNLKLMKWRLVPQLDLNALHRTKVLLLGSGTLGCNVARCLMGWGMMNITFVDNARVSYSNPVRQSLFTFNDCIDNGLPKSEAAVEAVRRIYPGVNARGFQMNIPMPGHSIPNAMRKEVEESITQLEKLIDESDVIFLLMDTRESRWLPTVVAAAKEKIVINAALGFDSFLVMRHGMRITPRVKTDLPEYQQLGCYFCNDVVAPGNSTKDRTLDQQCTVTRPGIAMIASALAVELLVTLLTHPKRAYAPFDVNGREDDEAESPLGIVPHQMRGFLSRHNTILPATTAFDKCTACSEIVLSSYEQRGHEFLFEVFNGSASLLEDLTGLTKLHQESENTEIWDLSDNDSLSS